MIRPLRTAHRRLFILLAVAVPLALAWVLLQRPTPPPAAPQAHAPATLTLVRDDAGTVSRVQVAVPGSRPELLVYVGDGDTPGPSARLLGTVTGAASTFALPPDARGNVLVYSPVFRSVVARVPLAAAP